MKLIIDIPEKTNAHIRSDYGHGYMALREEDKGILCYAVYHGIHYEERPHGTWRNYEGVLTCSVCNTEYDADIMDYFGDVVPAFCPECGADMREGERNE